MLKRIVLVVLVAVAALFVYESLSMSNGENHDQSTPTATASTQDSTSKPAEKQQFTVNVDDIELSILQLPEWDRYPTKDGVVLAEHPQYTASGDRRDGLVTHVFVPTLEDLVSASGEKGDNAAVSILKEIVVRPEYVGTSAVSQPAAFDWDGHDAAYYLMDSGEGRVMLVIGVVVPDVEWLIATSISAPTDESGRIRPVLSDLLDGLTINNTTLHGQALNSLPDPLDFPRYDHSKKAPQRGS